jgi:hypothetical protein
MVLAVACLILGAPGWASALELGGATVAPVADPVGTTVDAVTDTAPLPGLTDATKAVTDTVEDAADDVVKDVPQPVKDPVRRVVDSVVAPVRRVTAPVTDKVNTVIDRIRDGSSTGPAAGSDTPGDTPATRHHRHATTQPTTPRDRVRHRAESGPARRLSRAGAPDPGPSKAAPHATGSRPTPQRGAAQSVAQAVVDASRQFRFPLLLAALVLLFLGIQNRIDGRDPKLAAGPEEEELVFA